MGGSSLESGAKAKLLVKSIKGHCAWFHRSGYHILSISIKICGKKYNSYHGEASQYSSLKREDKVRPFLPENESDFANNEDWLFQFN